MLFFMMNIMTLSIIFPFTKHPLSMGFILIMQTMMMSIMAGLMTSSFWFSYILFIILLGGALVLFIYMASVASNEKFNFSQNMLTIMLMMMLTNIVVFFMTDELMVKKINSSMNQMNMSYDQFISLTKLFNMQSMSITIMLVIYLFITMIAISNIINVHEGPMRMKS